MTDPTTTPAFTAAIARDSAEHSARDLYREWLEEEGQPEVCGLRAELIRVQEELAKCGPPHVRVGFDYDPIIIHGAGPGYWQFGMAEEDVHVGDRLDVRYDNGRGAKVKRGLLVTKIEGAIVTVKRDGQSGPWRGEQATKRERELLTRHAPTWAGVECPTCKGKPIISEEWRGETCETTVCLVCNGTGDAMFYSVRINDGQWLRGSRNPQWHRGYVTQIECRLDEVGGDRCNECGGSGNGIRWEPGIGPAKGCRLCHGTGRVFQPSAWIKAVFERWPIERVRITDREPVLLQNGPHVGQYFWVMRDWRFLSESLPNNKVVSDYYPTADAAKVALHHAVADVVRKAVWGKPTKGEFPS